MFFLDTKKVQKGISTLHPESWVNIGDKDVIKRLPEKKQKVLVKNNYLHLLYYIIQTILGIKHFYDIVKKFTTHFKILLKTIS